METAFYRKDIRCNLFIEVGPQIAENMRNDCVSKSLYSTLATVGVYICETPKNSSP